MTESFSILFARAQAGDRDAAEELLQRHLRDLRAYVRLRSGPALRARESCSDLVQTVCREVLQDLDGVSCATEDAFRGWLYTVAHHKLATRAEFHDAERRSARHETPSGEAAAVLLGAYARVCTPSHQAAAREELARVEAAFDRLVAQDREVILDACIAGLSHREIAARLDKTEAAVRKQLSRARARLAILLDGHG